MATHVESPPGVPAERWPGEARSAQAARTAQPTWARLGPAERAGVIAAAARLLAAEAPALATHLAAATARPQEEIWSAEILPTLDALRWLHRRGVRHLRPRPLSRSWVQWYFRATRHTLHWDPFGVIGVVMPGTSLLFLPLSQIAAALVAGNAVLWKPAPGGEAVAAQVAGLLGRAGLPPGTLHLVPGGPEAARGLVEAGVDKLFFTGGPAAGRELYGRQADRGRPAVLELSGRHVAVVLADADPGLAAGGIAWGKLANGGRNCVSVQLVLVERPIWDAFVEAARGAMTARESAGGGTVVPGEDVVRLRVLVADALAHGARLVCGDDDGPTLLADVAPGMRVVEEEVLGPLLGVAAVESEAEAVAWINRAEGRLSASVWAGDPARARQLALRLDAGQVWINDVLHPAAQPEVPLAGRGASGFGASRGLPGLMEMVQPKVVSETPLRSPRRHYRPAGAGAVAMFRATAALAAPSGLRRRAAGLAALIASLAGLRRGV